MIKVYGMGRLGADPEVRSTAGGKVVCNLRVAFDSGWGEQKSTVWLACSVWGESGRVAGEQLAKGAQVILDGELRQREYTDRDGHKRTAYEVQVSTWRHAERRPQASATGDDDGWTRQREAPATAKGSAKQTAAWPDSDDPIPF